MGVGAGISGGAAPYAGEASIDPLRLPCKAMAGVQRPVSVNAPLTVTGEMRAAQRPSTPMHSSAAHREYNYDSQLCMCPLGSTGCHGLAERPWTARQKDKQGVMRKKAASLVVTILAAYA